MDNNFENVYIVLSQSGSIISNILKFITKSEYNHVSLSLYSDLHEMYSFGRRFAYYPFWSGLVIESLNKGTFKRFNNTDILVLSAKVPKSNYFELANHLNYMLKRKHFYGYNYIGVGLSYFKIYHKAKRRFYCSEFVREMLIKANACGVNKLSLITYPNNFLNVEEFKYIYKGKYKNFNNYVLKK